MAPARGQGQMLIGNSGGEFGAQGWLTWLDAATGKQRWRAYSTGPDTDVLMGADYQLFYAMNRGKDLGVSSWPADAWQQDGGSVWGWFSYDPELDLVFYGTPIPRRGTIPCVSAIINSPPVSSPAILRTAEHAGFIN
jgi:glucose dehydrogenase